LWVLGDEVEQSLPVDLEFAEWHEEELIGEHGSHIEEYHGWTDGSRRMSAAFGWSLRGYNDQGKEVELDCNKGSLGEFETAFDGEMDRTVAQIRTGHWLCAPYLKRVRKIGKNRYRINAGGVASIECPVPTSFAGARKDFWDRPDEDDKIRKRPTSVGQLLGKSKWEKPLADWITATGVGLVGQDRVDKEDERVERNDGWRWETFLKE
jgi:hypothetical protein